VLSSGRATSWCSVLGGVEGMIAFRALPLTTSLLPPGPSFTPCSHPHPLPHPCPCLSPPQHHPHLCRLRRVCEQRALGRRALLAQGRQGAAQPGGGDSRAVPARAGQPVPQQTGAGPGQGNKRAGGWVEGDGCARVLFGCGVVWPHVGCVCVAARDALSIRSSPHSTPPHPTPVISQVIRIQPNEGIYLKINNKVPGLGLRIDTTRLDLTYKSKYQALLPGGCRGGRVGSARLG